MDRNRGGDTHANRYYVALRKESVDRNPNPLKFCAICQVALRKESVDRNGHGVFVLILRLGSLSARRAWIEIGRAALPFMGCDVALRKESVDRNHDGMLKYRDAEQSLSARRAWIEIGTFKSSNSVGYRRSPQGERG